MCSNVEEDEAFELDAEHVVRSTAKLDDTFVDKLKMDKIKLGETENCKCGQPAVIYLRTRNVFCVSCLQLSVNHKFRSCLGKSHIMKAGEKILIAFSGGQSSVAMLHLTKQGLDVETSHKKLLFTPYIVYVDESAISNDENNRENGRKIIGEIEATVKDYGFPLHVTSIEKVMGSLSDCQLDDKCGDVASRRLVRELFDSVKSLTSKEDLLSKLRQTLLCSVARHLGCSKVFLGDSESRLAIRVLADIAQGKGRQLSLTCGFVDDRFSDILMVRPMREILAKEIAFYVSSKELGTVTQSTFTTKHENSYSIQHLTEKFVFGLQREFPATISTIFRTADKISKKGMQKARSEDLVNNCILCTGPLDDVTENVRILTQESSKVLTNDEPSSCSSNCSNCSPNTSTDNRLEKEDLKLHMCHSCRIILDEISCVDILPRFAMKSANYRIRRSKMKSEIQEYLLEENEDKLAAASGGT